MPTYIVTRARVLHKVTVKAESQREAIAKARVILIREAEIGLLHARKQADDVRL